MLSVAGNDDLAIVNTLCSTCKGKVSHIFKGKGKNRVDFILTRQSDRRLVRNVIVHQQPEVLQMSDPNIASACVRPTSRFAVNRRIREHTKSIDCQRLRVAASLRKRLPRYICDRLPMNPLMGAFNRTFTTERRPCTMSSWRLRRRSCHAGDGKIDHQDGVEIKQTEAHSRPGRSDTEEECMDNTAGGASRQFAQDGG